MDNAERAIMMAFAVIVLGIALALAMFMFSSITVTSEQLTFYTDSTAYYDNVQLTKVCANCSKVNPYDNNECEDCKVAFPDITDDHIKNGTTRVVGAETIIPTLYRYYKENFCVKIYDATNNLIQIFDVNLEGKVHGATGDTHAEADATNPTHIRNYAYNQVYNDTSKDYCLFGAPWLGSTESVKSRVDYFITGKAGYINNTYINYINNKFYQARINGKQFTERFINYSYSGQKMITEDGDELVTGEKSKDKIVIIYTLMD